MPQYAASTGSGRSSTVATAVLEEIGHREEENRKCESSHHHRSGEKRRSQTTNAHRGRRRRSGENRACGICGSDTLSSPSGFESATARQYADPATSRPGEVVEVGRDVRGIAVGDRVVINPMAIADDIIGNGGSTGALADYLLIKRCGSRPEPSRSCRDHIPYEVAALNEPMAAARPPRSTRWLHGPERPGAGARCAALSDWVGHHRLEIAWRQPRCGGGHPARPARQSAEESARTR